MAEVLSSPGGEKTVAVPILDIIPENNFSVYNQARTSLHGVSSNGTFVFRAQRCSETNHATFELFGFDVPFRPTRCDVLRQADYFIGGFDWKLNFNWEGLQKVGNLSATPETERITLKRCAG